MCFIVDSTHVLSFFKAPDACGLDLLSAELSRNKPKPSARIIVSGHLLGEWAKFYDILRLLQIYRSANRAKVYDDAEYYAHVKIWTTRMKRKYPKRKIENLPDPHVLALAALSSARLLCTADTDLIKVFKDTQYISPKGSIYVRKAHQALLKKHCG